MSVGKRLAGRPEALTDAITHYCPGCSHGVLHRLVAEVIDELGIRTRTVGVASVGCSVLAYNYFNVDFVSAPHGRAPAVATGVKRARPDRVVFTYQGDGDLAAIGTAEAIHAAARGEFITVILYNNGIYGMTGGQMSPTTLVGAITATTPYGRDAATAGQPLKVAELLAQLPGVAYAARVHLADPRGIARAKTALRRAFTAQLEGRGFALVEALGNCPTNWGITPEEANRYVLEAMAGHFPVGEFRTWDEGGAGP